MNFQDYTLFDTTAPIVNEAIVGADQGDGSDDAEVVNLEQQEITLGRRRRHAGLGARPAPRRRPSSRSRTPPAARSRAPRSSTTTNRNGMWDGGAGGEESRYTDAERSGRLRRSDGLGRRHGLRLLRQHRRRRRLRPDQRLQAHGHGHLVRPGADAITATSADGPAFDVDENDADDLQVKLVDQNGDGIPGKTVSYSLSIVPFTDHARRPRPPRPPPARSRPGADGKANIPFTNKGNGTYTLKTYVEQNGTPGQQDGDLSGADLVFKAGDSSLRFVDAPSATSIAGTTDTYDATLALGDGTPLPGRSVLFTFTKNATGNAVVAAQGAQPTGTTRNGDSHGDRHHQRRRRGLRGPVRPGLARPGRAERRPRRRRRRRTPSATPRRTRPTWTSTSSTAPRRRARPSWCRRSPRASPARPPTARSP